MKKRKKRFFRAPMDTPRIVKALKKKRKQKREKNAKEPRL